MTGQMGQVKPLTSARCYFPWIFTKRWSKFSLFSVKIYGTINICVNTLFSVSIHGTHY